MDSKMKDIIGKALLAARRRGGSEGFMPDGAAAPVVALVDDIIREALARRASDIHIEPVEKGLRVRYRVDGVLETAGDEIPQELSDMVQARVKVMAGLNTTEHYLPQDGRFTWKNGDFEVDVRASTMPVMRGESLVLRLLTGAREFRTIEELGFLPENEKLFREWCRVPYGLLILCGPVNSGKSTTLYAALHALNTSGRNIVTIEDPVECRIEGINQMQVNARTELTFAKGLRAILRQDPDVCMVGEIRDEETAEAAVRAALSGRLLFTTLHTDSAAGAVFRLLDMGIPPYLLAAALLGIVAQRLVRRLCPACREAYEVEEGSREAVLLGENYHPGVKLWRAKGCSECRNTGYQGRIAVHELLRVTPAVRQAVIDRMNRGELSRLVAEEGLVPLMSDAVKKALAGHTSMEEIGRVIHGGF